MLLCCFSLFPTTWSICNFSFIARLFCYQYITRLRTSLQKRKVCRVSSLVARAEPSANEVRIGERSEPVRMTFSCQALDQHASVVDSSRSRLCSSTLLRACSQAIHIKKSWSWNCYYVIMSLVWIRLYSSLKCFLYIHGNLTQNLASFLHPPKELAFIEMTVSSQELVIICTSRLPQCCCSPFCSHLSHKADSRHTSLPFGVSLCCQLSNTLSIHRQMTSYHNRPKTCWARPDPAVPDTFHLEHASILF